MNDNQQSHIDHHAGGTSFVGRDAVEIFRARVIASALKLYARTGMKANRAYTPSAMLASALQITGKKFKRGQYLLAAEALTAWADGKPIAHKVTAGAQITLPDGRSVRVVTVNEDGGMRVQQRSAAQLDEFNVNAQGVEVQS